MPVQIGLSSSWSIAQETTYGTLVTPSRTIPILSESLKYDIKRTEAKTLKAGNFLETSTEWRVGAHYGQGAVQTYLWSSGASLLWAAMLGANADTGAGPYTHTANIANPLPSYSMDVTIGGVGSGSMRKTLLGAMCDTWELKLAAGMNVTLGLNWVYQTESIALGAQRGTQPASQYPFNFTMGVVSGSGLPTGSIVDMTLKGNNNLKKDQFAIGSQQIVTPFRNGKCDITGDMTVLLDGTTTNYALYTAGTEVAVILTLTDGTKTCTITTNARIDGETPTVHNEGGLQVKVPLKVIAPTTDASGFQVVSVNGDAVA